MPSHRFDQAWPLPLPLLPSDRLQREPGQHVEPVQHGLQHQRRLEPAAAQLEQEDVRVHHGVGEVALDVGHSLALDLEPVAHPHLAHDLVERHLQKVGR